MADLVLWQLDKEIYTICQQHDLLLRLVEHVVIDGESKPHKAHEYRVRRDALTEATYFRALLANAEESAETLINLTENHPLGLATWLKILHGTWDDGTTGAGTIEHVWHVLHIAHTYGFSPKTPAAKDWFNKWYTTDRLALDSLSQKDFKAARGCSEFEYHRQLLFPTHAFDHAHGFRLATEFVVYNARYYITESRPDGVSYDGLHLSSNIIQQMNAARARLKTILHRELYRPIDLLLSEAVCQDKEKALYAYELALYQTSAWPLEIKFIDNSIEMLCYWLEHVRPNQPKTCGSPWCTIAVKAVVDRAIKKCLKYFDGLCLDCMNASMPKLETEDRDYWKHTALGVAWDHKCRESHGESSWHYSFMGRRQKMIDWVKSQKGSRDYDDDYDDDDDNRRATDSNGRRRDYHGARRGNRGGYRGGHRGNHRGHHRGGHRGNHRGHGQPRTNDQDQQDGDANGSADVLAEGIKALNVDGQ